MNKETALQHVDFILKRNADNPQDSVDDLVRLIDDILNPDNYYCAKCGSCGEPPCCDFSLCSNLRCKYGESYIKSYEEMSKDLEFYRELRENLDWQDELPFDMYGAMYVWLDIDASNDDIVMGGLCSVWMVDDPSDYVITFGGETVHIEEHYKRVHGDIHFYDINGNRMAMKFFGYPPLMHDGEPCISKIAKFALPPQPRLYS